MIFISRYITSSDENVALNGTIPFDIVSIPCGKGCVIPITTGVLTLKGNTPNRFARYEVTVQGNIAIPEGGTVTPIAIAITLNDVAIPDSVAIVVAFFYQKYEFERDDEWEWCEELVFPQGSDNWETVIFQNDFCEGQTCVKDITIVELDKITSYYAENVITT